MKLYRKISLAVAAALLCLTLCCGCGKADKQAVDPHYWPEPGREDAAESPDGGEEEAYYAFTLALRYPGGGRVVEEDDMYPHYGTDGELIREWRIPFYGNTVYEAVKKYFAGIDEGDSITFRLSQRRFYMFHKCALADGETFDLETVYIDADGKYSMCANYQELLGGDRLPGTGDDLEVLTLVYRGWLTN